MTQQFHLQRLAHAHEYYIPMVKEGATINEWRCMYVLYVCMYACKNGRFYVCMYVGMNVWRYECMYICIYICTNVCKSISMCLYVCMYV